MAPRLPVRDEEKLRAQFPGRSPEEIADALIDGASRAAAAIGASVGVWSVLPVAPAFPAEVATETLALVGIELKLIAELHEVYGMRPPGDFPNRMTAFVGAWARRRGVALAPSGVVFAMGSPVARQLRRRLAARASRSAFSLAPLLTGAAAGALINRRETRRLGSEVRDDLRHRSPLATAWADERLRTVHSAGRAPDGRHSLAGGTGILAVPQDRHPAFPHRRPRQPPEFSVCVVLGFYP